MMKKILLLSNVLDGYHILRLKEELDKKGIQSMHAFYRNMHVHIETDDIYISDISGIPIHTATYVIPRAPVSKSRLLLAALAMKNPVLNGKALIHANGVYNKYTQYLKLAEAHIPVIETQTLFTASAVEEDVKGFTFPLIAKLTIGGQGRNVFMPQNIEELNVHLKEHSSYQFIIQKYIPNSYDLRVLLLDKKVIGVMKRYSQTDDFRNNFSLGGAVEQFPLTDEIEEIAVKAATVLNFDYCGVDLIYDRDKLKVMEVNIYPQFKGFEQSTDINVAKLLVEYALMHDA